MAPRGKPTLKLRNDTVARAARSKRNRPAAKTSRAKPASAPSRFDWSRVRLLGVGCVFALVWVLLWVRAFQVQVVRGETYAKLAERRQFVTEINVGRRGSILDRNGNVLAKSVEATSVAIQPQAVKDKQAVIALFSRAFGMSAQKARSFVDSPKQFLWVARKVNPRAAEILRAEKQPGVVLQREYERLYPFKHMAGQLVGFVDVDDKGIEGLEKSLDETLSGQRKRRVLQRDARRRAFYSGKDSDFEDLSGDDIKLTLDTQVQYFAESALAEGVGQFGAKWAACVVVDVPTGDILAWAEYPFFNPNRPREFTQFQRRNKVAMDALEQGSTMKPFLMAAALQEGVIKPNSVYNCEKGQWKLHNVVIRDTSVHANLDARSILRVSSNIGVAKIGLDLGARKYYQYLSGLGFGQRTGLPLPGESKGIMHPLKQWTEVDLASASFGQGISSTILQMAQAYLCLANDGVRKELRLLAGEERTGASTSRLFSKGTVREVREMMRQAVEEKGGTGRKARIQGISVGGKTGTAQKASGDAYGAGRVASFAGMLPINKPRYVVIVMFDEPVNNQYGGTVTAPIFQNVALRTMAYHGLLPENTPVQALAELAHERETAASAESSRPATVFPGILPGMNISTRDAGSDAASQSNDPKGARLVSISRTGKPGKVPSVVGLSVRKAVEQFARQGLMPGIKGNGDVVVRQQPEPGSIMPGDPASAECILWVEERSS